MQTLRVLRLLGGCALLSLFLSTSAQLTLAQNKDSEQITTLLSQARTQAWQAAQDADILQSYTNSPMTWESHAAQLRLITNDIDELAKTTVQLNGLRPQGSSWQQAAIDRINPLLKDLDDTVGSTIRTLAANPSQVNMPPYREYAHESYDVAQEAAAVISDYVRYGKAKSAVRSPEVPPASN